MDLGARGDAGRTRNIPLPQVRRPKLVFSTQHGHGGNAGRLEAVREIEPVLRRGPLGKESMEALPLFPPASGMMPLLVPAPGGPAHDFAERQPLAVVLDGYDDPGVVAAHRESSRGAPSLRCRCRSWRERRLRRRPLLALRRRYAPCPRAWRGRCVHPCPTSRRR